MFFKNIIFKNFKIKKNNNKIQKDLNLLLKEKNPIIETLGTSYRYSYSKKIISKLKKYTYLKVIGMGGSTLGTQAIHDFLKHKIKKNFFFIDNIQSKFIKYPKKNYINLVVSKSGNTLETISNSNIIIKKKHNTYFITENKDSYLSIMLKN